MCMYWERIHVYVCAKYEVSVIKTCGQEERPQMTTTTTHNGQFIVQALRRLCRMVQKETPTCNGSIGVCRSFVSVGKSLDKNVVTCPSSCRVPYLPVIKKYNWFYFHTCNIHICYWYRFCTIGIGSIACFS